MLEGNDPHEKIDLVVYQIGNLITLSNLVIRYNQLALERYVRAYFGNKKQGREMMYE